jgi:hypothetical protein
MNIPWQGWLYIGITFFSLLSFLGFFIALFHQKEKIAFICIISAFITFLILFIVLVFSWLKFPIFQ